jgi:hypothetical protein
MEGITYGDEEIIDYCLDKLAGVPYKKRGAQFRTVLAVARTVNR